MLSKIVFLMSFCIIGNVAQAQIQSASSCGNLMDAKKHFLRWSHGLADLENEYDNLPAQSRSSVLRAALRDSAKDLRFLASAYGWTDYDRQLENINGLARRYDNGEQIDAQMLLALRFLRTSTDRAFQRSSVSQCEKAWDGYKGSVESGR